MQIIESLKPQNSMNTPKTENFKDCIMQNENPINYDEFVEILQANNFSVCLPLIYEDSSNEFSLVSAVS